MSGWLLWLITTVIVGNPFVALLIVLAVFYFGSAQFTGRAWNPFAPLQRKRQIDRLRTAIEANPENAAAHNDLGRILALRGRFAEAIPHLEKARKRSPDSAETAFFFGYALLATGREEEGLTLIEEALAEKPRMRYGEPYRLTGDVYLRAGRFVEALPWYETFTRLNTDSTEGFYKLGKCLAGTGREEEARAALRAALAAYRQAPRFIRRAQRLWYLKAAWRLRRFG
jgi:tetratricopeptide (TPR) repeat protein